jgi:hypothetical protein
MKPKETLEIRAEMAIMHEEYIERLSNAYDSGNYIETVWICYAVFEQRVNRLIVKYIDNCTIPERVDNKTVSISTRIKCLERLIDMNYGAFNGRKKDIFNKIFNWCNKRNELVHGLVNLKHYKKYDDEFKELAEQGVPLVFELYDFCTDFRECWYKQNDEKEEFPMKKCKCKKQKCLNPNCI